MATITVLKLISTAPNAEVMRMPALNRTPDAIEKDHQNSTSNLFCVFQIPLYQFHRLHNVPLKCRELISLNF
jgi:hypothetical protein